MKENNKVFSKRSGLLSAGTLSVLLALGGCGGGGGGGGGVAPTTGGTIVFPDLDDATPAQISGFTSPYALDPETPELRSVDLRIIGAGSVDGQLEITVAAIDLPDPAGLEPGFLVTFDLTKSGDPLGNSPLGGLCPGCLRTATAPYFPLGGGGPSPGDVTFTYLDPDPTSFFSLTYSTLGMWSKPTTVETAEQWLEVGGPFSAGVTAIHLPATGTADYDGFFIGRYASSETSDSGTYVVGANADARVDFGLSAVTSFNTHGTMVSKEGSAGLEGPPIDAPELDLRMAPGATMTIDNDPTSTSFASFAGGGGTLTNDFDMGATGEITGGFYGPSAGTLAPPELGGALAVGNPGNTRSLVGSFGLKQTPSSP